MGREICTVTEHPAIKRKRKIFRQASKLVKEENANKAAD